jgi:hypothetical protein
LCGFGRKFFKNQAGSLKIKRFIRIYDFFPLGKLSYILDVVKAPNSPTLD